MMTCKECVNWVVKRNSITDMATCMVAIDYQHLSAAAELPRNAVATTASFGEDSWMDTGPDFGCVRWEPKQHGK